MRKETLIPNEYYHIYSRTLLGIPEFRNKENATKLAQAFLLANSTKSGDAFDYLRNDRNSTLEKALEIARNGKKLADILCYSIMPDHYHLLVREKLDNGISKFIHKCNVSIAKYINIKNNRRGPLFENRFNAKHVNTNEYLLHLSLYIHLNPLDFLIGKEWRNNELKDWPSAREKLLHYPWSSIKSFMKNDHNDPIISETKIIKQQFNNPLDYENFLKEWSKNSSEGIAEIIIDD